MFSMESAKCTVRLRVRFFIGCPHGRSRQILGGAIARLNTGDGFRTPAPVPVHLDTSSMYKTLQGHSKIDEKIRDHILSESMPVQKRRRSYGHLEDLHDTKIDEEFAETL